MNVENIGFLLRSAIVGIEEMQDILDEGEVDAPMAFLEAAHAVQHDINQAVHMALGSVLFKDAPSEAPLSITEKLGLDGRTKN